MGVRRYQDLIAWQMADAFKREVFKIVLGSQAASVDQRYKSQLLAAAQSVAANIAEGFLRDSPGDGLGSLGEAEARLRDGILLRYFTEASCEQALRYGRRCAVATIRLRKTQQAFMKARRPRT